MEYENLKVDYLKAFHAPVPLKTLSTPPGCPGSGWEPLSQALLLTPAYSQPPANVGSPSMPLCPFVFTPTWPNPPLKLPWELWNLLECPGVSLWPSKNLCGLSVSQETADWASCLWYFNVNRMSPSESFFAGANTSHLVSCTFGGVNLCMWLSLWRCGSVHALAWACWHPQSGTPSDCDFSFGTSPESPGKEAQSSVRPDKYQFSRLACSVLEFSVVTGCLLSTGTL